MNYQATDEILDTYPLGRAIDRQTKLPVGFYLHDHRIFIHDDVRETLTPLPEAPPCHSRSTAHALLRDRFPNSTHELTLFD